MDITQAQLSRIENGPPIVHLDRLIQWARTLHIPAERLWFEMPEAATGSREEDRNVKRRSFLAATGMTVAGGLLPAQIAKAQDLSVQEAAEWLAWRLWQLQTYELDSCQIPGWLSDRLDLHPYVVRTAENVHRFTDPTLVDLLVAERIFGGIAAGDSHLLATAQTSHTTDLTLSTLATHHDTARRGLSRWMTHGPTPVLRVNAAGVLAKVGTPELGDAAISAIRRDHDARHLYLTAVAGRVLAMNWEQAAHLVADVGGERGGSVERLPHGQRAWAAEKLTAELANPRDAGARWCSAVLLSALPDPTPDAVRAALGNAAQREQCRENLRAYAAVLAGINPVT